jgi:hypothetical protein
MQFVKRSRNLLVLSTLSGCFSLIHAAGALSSPGLAPASAVNPYAARVVRTSNDGLEDKLVTLGVLGGSEVAQREADQLSLQTPSKAPTLPDIPDVDTTGFICQTLTLQPAQGCLETQLSICTSLWCTSLLLDECTNGDYCTKAAQCTNVKGCTDAGTCTEENGCTGGDYCTSSSGCTQNDSCTNGTNCTNDAGTCTGGDTCTKGTGCTNGNNCTAGSGCTKDAQCTDGTQCTKGGGSNCTNGNMCTKGANCKDPILLGDPDDASFHASAVSGAQIDECLDRFGAPDPEQEPHFAPRPSLASLGWLGLLLVPGLLRRARRES